MFAEALGCVLLLVVVAHIMYDFTYMTAAEGKGGCDYCIAWMCTHVSFNACLNGDQMHPVRCVIGAIDNKQVVCGVATHARWSWLWKQVGCSCCFGTFTLLQIIYRSSTQEYRSYLVFFFW